MFSRRSDIDPALIDTILEKKWRAASRCQTHVSLCQIATRSQIRRSLASLTAHQKHALDILVDRRDRNSCTQSNSARQNKAKQKKAGGGVGGGGAKPKPYPAQTCTILRNDAKKTRGSASAHVYRSIRERAPNTPGASGLRHKNVRLSFAEAAPLPPQETNKSRRYK